MRINIADRFKKNDLFVSGGSLDSSDQAKVIIKFPEEIKSNSQIAGLFGGIYLSESTYKRRRASIPKVEIGKKSRPIQGSLHIITGRGEAYFLTWRKHNGNGTFEVSEHYASLDCPEIVYNEMPGSN